MGQKEAKTKPVAKELQGLGSAVELLGTVVNQFPFRTQTVDLLLEAIKNRKSSGPEPEYKFLPTIEDFVAFAKDDRENKLFLMVHPEKKGKRFACIARSDDEDGLVGWSYSNWDQLWKGDNCPAVNFTIVHAEGYGEPVWGKIGKAQNVHWTGSQNAIDIVVDGKTIKPKKERIGEGCTSDATLVASIPVTETKTKTGRYSTVSSYGDWPKGWQVYGLTGVSAKNREQERQFKKERKRMTIDEIKHWLETEKHFLQGYEYERRGYQASDSYPAMKSYEKSNKIAALIRSEEQTKRDIARLEQSLKDSNVSITFRDLRIRLWE